MPTSGPYILQVVQQVAPTSDAGLMQSPLWPLQSAMRDKLQTATNSADLNGSQIARLTATSNDVENLFGQYTTYGSLSKLRDAIYAIVDPNNGLDLSDDPTLTQLQQDILNLPQWNDTLPS